MFWIFEKKFIFVTFLDNNQPFIVFFFPIVACLILIIYLVSQDKAVKQWMN